MSRPPEDRLSLPRVLSHLVLMTLVAVVLGVVAAGLAIPFAGAIGVGTRQVADSMEKLPADLEPKDLNQRTQMVDARGNVISTLYAENRVNVPLGQISRTMVKAIVAIEDYRFYEHGALDLKGTLRAFITNQSSGGTVQGGSSITQQVVKLTLVNQAKSKADREAATARTYARKLAELRYAIALEKKHSKDWILERYLNTAYFGDGAYGVQAAARHYFGVNAKDLDLRQAALLAGLVKNPTGYDPTNAPDRAIERRNTVLERMAQLSVISEKKAERAKKQRLGLHTERVYNGCVNSAAPFFCDYVYNFLLHDADLGETVRDRKALLKRGGLTIRTTIDLRDQRAADQAVARHVYPRDAAIGALAMVEPRTGAVKAIAQSRPMGGLVRQGQTYLNYVVPQEYGDSAGFQAGSTFKAFVLASAIRQNIPMNETISSPPQIDMAMNEYPDCGGHNFYSTDTWPVANSTTSGAKNMYTGTRESVNTFFAQLEQKTGLCMPYKLAKAMGVRLTDPARERIPSFTLGTPSVSPLEMAEAYATFAGRGLHCASHPVTAIVDSTGKEIKSYDPHCAQVIPSSVADAVNDVLRGVQEGNGFGASAGLGLTVPSAGKTGTTDENRAVWFVGYTPSLTTASMIAGIKGDGTWDTLNGKVVGGSYIDAAHGSTTAGPMWGDAMHVIQRWLPDVDFTAPPSGEIAGLLRTVPNVSGMGLTQATQTLESAGFVVAQGGSVRSGYAKGTVAYTSPGAGSSFGDGDTIYVYLSNGKKPHTNGGRGHGHGHGHGGR